MGKAESIVIKNKNCKNTSLVKLQKNKVDNTLILDIITAENQNPKPTYPTNHSNKPMLKHLSKFSILYQISDLSTDISNRNQIFHYIRFFSILWVILLHTVTILSYSSSKYTKLFNKPYNNLPLSHLVDFKIKKRNSWKSTFFKLRLTDTKP